MKYFFLKLKNTIFIISIFVILKKILYCQINDNFQSGTLETRASILDVADYLNLSILVTSSGKIYNAAPLSLKITTNANLNASSSIAICSENYLLAACLVDFLLIKINLNTGEYVGLLYYSEFNSIELSSTYSSCSLSIYNNIVLIGVSQPASDNKIKNAIIKLNIKNKDDLDNGPVIDTEIEKKLFIFPVEHKKTSTTRDISCEIIVEKASNDYRFICVYENIEDPDSKIVTLVTINNLMENFEKIFYPIHATPYEFGFKLYKIDNYFIKLVLRTGVYDLNLDQNFDLICKSVNSRLKNYNSYWDLFSYHNNIVIIFQFDKYYNNEGTVISRGPYLEILTTYYDYYTIYLYSYAFNAHKKLYNYYNEEIDYLTILYQSSNSIEYFTFHDNKNIYNIKSLTSILKVKSNEDINFDVSNLIETDTNFGNLYIKQYKIIPSSDLSQMTKLTYPLDSLTFPIDKENHIMDLEPSNNLWYEFTFAFEERNDAYLRMFSLPSTKLVIRTCAFQCGSCESDYYICDTCRDLNYAKKYNSEDTNCYPINQLIKNYIYDSSTNYFEECYNTCQFCSKKGSLSSSSEHNCLSCADGYLPSYEYLGNCYIKNNDIDINNDIYININSDPNFSSIDKCSSLTDKNYKVTSTKECINSCPTINSYYSYECTNVDFTEQEYDKQLAIQCISTEINSPKYYLGNYCYESCPPNSDKIETNSYECKCNFAWHKDRTTDEIICYEVDYCQYENYKYYHDNTKECSNNCNTGYFQFNFQCYNGGCPTDSSNYDINKCESNYNYCYINENYKNICSNTQFNDYIYKYDNTKQYLKNCQESLIYTISERKTYLYKGVCYLDCPENTNEDDENEICDCLYFKYYNDINTNTYICYSQTEKCNDKIPVNDISICLDSIEECTENNYKVFNNECYSIECPINTEIKNINDNNCFCKNYFYNNNGILNCYDSSTESCEIKNHDYSNPITKECFNSLEDCFNKNNIFYFNKFCYKESCPDEYIPLSSILDNNIKNDFITNLNINDDNINKICVCDIINNNINWELDLIDDIYTQKCVNVCKDEYKPNNISSRCIESCLDYKHYMFNDECYYEGCPTRTKLGEENGHICICENWTLINDNNKLECYNSLEDCQTNNLLYYNEEFKQCFSSLDNCFNNNYNYFYNKQCYKNECPPGHILLSDIIDITIKNKFIELLDLNSNSDLINKICVCDIISDSNLKWSYDIINKEQKCLNTCPEDLYESEPEEITHKCVDKCDPLIDYTFNEQCYKYGCPEGTKSNNDGTKTCICENLYYINEDNNEMICCTNENQDDVNCIQNFIYPPEYYKNPDKCLAIYNNKCYLKCPQGTCLTQRDINLINCVQIKSYMRVFNDICFTNFEEIEYNIKNISDNDMYIIPSTNIMIKAYTKNSIKADINSNYSYIELGDCERILKENYNLSPDEILYILGIETPNKNKLSAINTYNFGVYLDNGTQLNISLCEEKISIYSTIKNRSLIKLEQAHYFNSYGYNIYNKSDDFYIDICSPASIDGNDITLNDRFIDFFPSNISMCNESCEFDIVNLSTEKIKCSCHINFNISDMENTIDNKEDFSYTYLEYFLSLFNYKIVSCNKLLLIFNNYKNNIGFYVGIAIIIICIFLMFLNLHFGIRAINKIIKENEPIKLLLKKKKKKFNDSQTLNQNKKINSPSKRRKDKKISSKKNGQLNTKTLELKRRKKMENFKNNKNVEELNKKKLTYFNKLNEKNTKNIQVKYIVRNIKKKLSSKNKMLTINDNDLESYNALNIDLKNIRNPQKKLAKHGYINTIENKEDELIDKKDLNNIPYTQALRIDKRSLCELLFYILANKIEIINIFYYKSIYIHLSMSISTYLFAFLLDITMNCFLYTDDVVSEKYHNEGSLEMFTSLSLSFCANIISSIITYFLKRLGDYSDLLEMMTSELLLTKYYYMNIIKFRKYLKYILCLFYIIHFIMYIFMAYYITIFCIVYNKSQISIMINYIYGLLQSLAISFGITLIITLLRYSSLKYKCIKIYRTSQYLNDKF